MIVRIRFLKGSRYRERRGFGKVPNVYNMSLTAAINVLFSVNFAVVFDFTYFRFPSKEILTFFLFLFLDEPERGFWTGKGKIVLPNQTPHLGAGPCV
jgi:hypothetical protein